MTELDNAALGARVRAALDAGRARAHEFQRERTDALAAAVRLLAERDIEARRPARGRAARIARTGVASERHVRRILDTLSNVSE
jgi:hypothetical protein